MKIEIGESLFYSWLRHVKECQVVQTNWKTSLRWTLLHEDELEEIMNSTNRFFQGKYGYEIYKKTSSLSQLLQQAECDALGICLQEGERRVFAVDVAFHESGVNYGGRDATVQKIIAKSLRTAMCIYGYLDTKDAEIIFASPKINRNVLEGIVPGMEEAQKLLDDFGFQFRLRIIANEDFKDKILDPILLVSDGVADTNELFMRSYQMLQMFGRQNAVDSGKTYRKRRTEDWADKATAKTDGIQASWEDGHSEDAYSELKIGKLVQTVLMGMLEAGAASEEEVERLQTVSYSKETFDLQYPLLVRQDSDYDRARYYKKPIRIRGIGYLVCSQWFEVPANNDRPYLMRWIRSHQNR